ncbi:MAG: LysM peptidoglycan-binding domain-containing protein [Chloroflexi bacterium]|nr:LysM peptidoglycan-binding domain-containing protein [Chloroflexota bacterium]
MSLQKNTSKLSRWLKLIIYSLIATLIASCATPTATPAYFPTYDPFLPISGNAAENPSTPDPNATRQPTPTRVPLTVSPPASISADQPVSTPTPDARHALPALRQEAEQYVVQAGDTLGLIAQNYGISVGALMEANNITDPNLLEVGMTLNVPAPNPADAGTAFKVIPDSELVYGPASIYFNINDFIQSQNGYLASYTQDVNGTILSAEEIVYLVASNYSVNPRLLLALLEYQSGWVTNPSPFAVSYPMGIQDEYHFGLYRQLTWAADTLNRGYYLWKANAISTWVLNDGTVVPVDPTINAGTAAVQYFFAQVDDRATWEKDVDGTGLLLTYFVFFGNPFSYAIEPIVSPSITQPAMILPFDIGETWYYTGGPHGGWDSGSAWAALDFAPPGELGCATSPLWVTAIASGLVVRAENGAVMLDLDNDGYEQTGWNILYMHIAAEDRIEAGQYIFAGERIGHASCEGGVSNATHVHLARKFNGEWIAADGPLPFNLEGWVSSGTGREYDGFITNGSQTIEALNSANEENQITR